MALVTARPPPPAALAPLLRGLLSVSKLSLGSGTAKSQRSGRCLPSPSPRGSQLPGAGRRGDRERAVRVFKFHGAHPPRKRRSGRGRNGAFNVHTQPVPHFPGKNQTSVEIPHTLASFPVSPEPEGPWAPEKTRACSCLHPPLTSHRRDSDGRANTGAVAAVVAHTGTSMCQPATTGAIRAPSGPRQVLHGMVANLAPAMPRNPPKRSDHGAQRAKEIAIETASPPQPKCQPRGCPSQCPKGQPRGHPQGGHQSTQGANQQCQSRGGLHSAPRPTTMSKAVFTVPNGLT